MTPSERADSHLKAILILSAKLAGINNAMNREFDAVRAKYSIEIDTTESLIRDYEDGLEALVKDRRGEILFGEDRADLHHGAVMLKIETRVKRVRKMLDRLKEENLTQAIKINESVDWDVIDRFDDDTIARIGSDRVNIERFSYELKAKALTPEVAACA